MERKRWRDLVGPDRTFHISRNLMNRRDPVPVHDHDFAEILWIAEGNGTHRVNGRAFRMTAGDLTMILPADRHGLSPVGGATLNIVNVVIPAALVGRFRRQYFADEARWFPREGRGPAVVRLSAGQLEALGREVAWLAHAPRDARSIATFCLNLMRLIGQGPAMASDGRLPSWLSGAMREFVRFEERFEEASEPPTLRRFFRLAGRTQEHVARVMRRVMDVTPSAWVNAQRIRYAARLLEISDRSVLDVALDSGFENAGHFHRLFKSVFGVTPLRYRKRHRRIL